MSTLLLFIIGRNCAIVKWWTRSGLEPEIPGCKPGVFPIILSAQKEQDTFYLQIMIVFLFVFAERILNLSSAGVSPALTDSHLDASSGASYTILEDWLG